MPFFHDSELTLLLDGTPTDTATQRREEPMAYGAPEDLVEKEDYIVPLSSPMRRPRLTDSLRPRPVL